MCVLCNGLTDALRLVKRRQSLRPFKVTTPWGGRAEKKEGSGYGNLFVRSLPSVCFPSSCTPFAAVALWLSSPLCITPWGGGSSEFMMWCSNERRHGDSAASAQRPHLLFFLWLSLRLPTSLPAPLVCLCLSDLSVFLPWPSVDCPPIKYKYFWKDIIFHSECHKWVIFKCFRGWEDPELLRTYNTSFKRLVFGFYLVTK